jgi:Holliday junction resolvasome RuvABC endonuclease subunit
MSIDPGTTNTGIAIFNVNDLTFIPSLEYAATINSEKLLSGYKHVVHTHGTRDAKILAISNAINGYFARYMPAVIVAEAPFFNPHSPQAYAALTELLTTIKLSVRNINFYARFELIDPSSVKRFMGVNGCSGDKQLMRNALMRRLTEDVSMCDEHTIDAICVGLCKIYNYNILET